MARGIYSAIGRLPEATQSEVLRALNAMSAALDADTDADAVAVLPESARAAGAAAVEAIRAFEARVGKRCGAVVEGVSTPGGAAIELGNRDHVPFGAAHEDAALVVARALAALLTSLGATGTFAFTMD